jgi:hypothetical protein
MCRSSLLFPVVLLAGSLGCGDQPMPAEPSSTLDRSIGTERQVRGDGAQVMRIGQQFLFINDPDRDFSLTLGVPVSEAPECGGTGALTGGTLRVVTTPSQIENVLAQFHRQTLTLYDHFTANPCELTAADVIAQGVGNGKLGVLTRGVTTLFQIQASGTVELAGGGRARLLVKGHFHIDPAGVRVEVDRFRLKPIRG